MDKFTVTKAFSVLEKVLLIPEDEVYAEKFYSMYRLYSGKTRKLIGKVDPEKFESCSVKTVNFKIYDNSEAKEYLLDLIEKMRVKSRSKNQKDDLNVISGIVTSRF